MEFTYFNLNHWRGEVARVVIKYANLEVKDINYTFEEWGKLKQEGKLPYTKVPYLKMKDGEYLTQAAAISKYLGTIGGLMPTTPEGVARIDQVYAIVEEMTTNFGKTIGAEDKVAQRKVLIEGSMKAGLANLDKIIGSKEFVFGNKISVADILLWSSFTWLTTGDLEGVDVNFVKEFKNLVRVIENVAKDSKIAAYKKNDVKRITIT